VNVGNNTDLAWSASSDTDRYQVWLRKGTDPFVLMGETDTPDFSLDPLDYDVTYTWVIRSYNICGSYTDSPWWTFTTVLEPGVTVIVPNGNELWYIGHDKAITWTSQNVTGNVRIDISRNNGLIWSTIVSNTANDGSYTWTVSGPVSAACRIRVTSIDFPAATDMSNRSFQIAEPYITILQPNGGEVWYAPDNEYIYWTSGGAAKAVAIEISRDNGSSWEFITKSTLNDGEYLWRVEGPAAKECFIRISDALLSDTSDSKFAIQQRQLTITSPNGGEVWRIEKPDYITWNSMNITGNVKIEISRDNGNNWLVIAASAANNGHYEWTAIEPASDQCLIQVSSLDYPYISDQSNNMFVSTYLSDINMDLIVESQDLSELADQWLDSGDQVSCTLTADLFGGNCKVDIFDFAMMASEWLNGAP